MHFRYTCCLCEGLLHALGNFAISSVLLGIAFGLHFNFNSEGDLGSLSLLNRVVAPMSHSKEMFQVPIFHLDMFWKALAFVTLSSV